MLHRDVAQLGSAHVWGAWCRKFKSCHPDHRRRFCTVSFLLPFYAKMRKNGLNSGFWSTATIKLGKLEEKKLTRHKLSNKQSFKLSTILDRKITRNPKKAEYEEISVMLGF